MPRSRRIRTAPAANVRFRSSAFHTVVRAKTAFAFNEHMAAGGHGRARHPLPELPRLSKAIRIGTTSRPARGSSRQRGHRRFYYAVPARMRGAFLVPESRILDTIVLAVIAIATLPNADNRTEVMPVLITIVQRLFFLAVVCDLHCSDNSFDIGAIVFHYVGL